MLIWQVCRDGLPEDKKATGHAGTYRLRRMKLESQQRITYVMYFEEKELSRDVDGQRLIDLANKHNEAQKNLSEKHLDPTHVIEKVCQAQLRGKHGTPAEFDKALFAAMDDLLITKEEAEAASKQYHKEWVAANEKTAADVPEPELKKKVLKVKPGIYKHYKGDEYNVLGTVPSPDGSEELVIYHTVDAILPRSFSRTVSSFLEEVEVKGEEGKRPRFEPMNYWSHKVKVFDNSWGSWGRDWKEEQRGMKEEAGTMAAFQADLQAKMNEKQAEAVSAPSVEKPGIHWMPQHNGFTGHAPGESVLYTLITADQKEPKYYVLKYQERSLLEANTRVSETVGKELAEEHKKFQDDCLKSPLGLSFSGWERRRDAYIREQKTTSVLTIKPQPSSNDPAWKELPTRTGYYWRKGRAQVDGGRVCYVGSSAAGLWYRELTMFHPEDKHPVEHHSGLWYGPIEAPV